MLRGLTKYCLHNQPQYIYSPKIRFKFSPILKTYFVTGVVTADQDKTMHFYDRNNISNVKLTND